MTTGITKRFIRFLVNSTVVTLLIRASNLTIPGVVAAISFLPVNGLSVNTTIVLLIGIILTFQGLRVVLDLVHLLDFASNFFVSHVPGLREEHDISVIKAVKELLIVLFLILTTTVLSLACASIPGFPYWATIGMYSVSITISGAFIYDAAKTFYTVSQSSLELLLDKFSSVLRRDG